MGHKASMSTLRCIRTMAACWASPRDRLICSSSCLKVLHRVVFGLPGFSFAWGCASEATFGMLSCSILDTAQPSQRRLSIHWSPFFPPISPISLYRSLLEILFGQKIWHTRRRHPSWNIFSSGLFWQLMNSLNPATEQSSPISFEQFLNALY